jgi:DNA-binding NarL/FixJ family response regulator
VLGSRDSASVWTVDQPLVISDFGSYYGATVAEPVSLFIEGGQEHADRRAAAAIAREANVYIREMAEELDAVAHDERAVRFVCECGCLGIVEATVAEYASADGAWVAGHTRGTPVRVLVVDDEEACRDACAEVVSSVEQFALAGCADSGEEALQLLPRLNPHLVLLDVRMPVLDGPETARRILKSQPGAVVVLMSADPDFEPVAASCGAAAFLPKTEVSPKRLSEVWAETRARAAEARREADTLQEEARAVKAQAEHQTRRAAKNLAPPKNES